jgi:hypothetical protein
MAPRPAGGSRAGRDLTQRTGERCASCPYTILLLRMRTPPREGGRRRGSKPKPELGADGAWVRTYNECVLPSVQLHPRGRLSNRAVAVGDVGHAGPRGDCKLTTPTCTKARVHRAYGHEMRTTQRKSTALVWFLTRVQRLRPTAASIRSPRNGSSARPSVTIPWP